LRVNGAVVLGRGGAPASGADSPARVQWGGQWSKPAVPVATPTQKVRLYAGPDPRDPSADIAYACTVRAGAGGNGIPASRATSRRQGVVSLGFSLSGLCWDAAGSMTLERGDWHADVICVRVCVCVILGSGVQIHYYHTHTHNTRDHACTQARIQGTGDAEAYAREQPSCTSCRLEWCWSSGPGSTWSSRTTCRSR